MRSVRRMKMKISDNEYVCEWCGENIKYIKKKSTGDINPLTKLPGRHTLTSTLKCPKCNRNVSQKRSDGSK